MVMLAADSLMPATLNDAKEFSMLLPDDKCSPHFLMVPLGDKVLAVCLEGSHKFSCWDAKGNSAYHGILVSGIELVADTASAFDFSRLDSPPGVLVRSGGMLGLNLYAEGMTRFAQIVPIFTNLPAGASNRTIGFNRWQITIGQGVDKQVLFEFDLASTASG